MKKTYIIPGMSVVVTLQETPVAASGVSSNNGIGYGGVDSQGELEPDVKANTFDFEWE